MDYRIEGSDILNAVVTVQNLTIDYEDETPIITMVDVAVIGDNDGTSLRLDGETIPSSTNYNAIKSWALNELKQFEI